jgi:hypothetical protein
MASLPGAQTAVLPSPDSLHTSISRQSGMDKDDILSMVYGFPDAVASSLASTLQYEVVGERGMSGFSIQ